MEKVSRLLKEPANIIVLLSMMVLATFFFPLEGYKLIPLFGTVMGILLAIAWGYIKTRIVGAKWVVQETTKDLLFLLLTYIVFTVLITVSISIGRATGLTKDSIDHSWVLFSMISTIAGFLALSIMVGAVASKSLDH